MNEPASMTVPAPTPAVEIRPPRRFCRVTLAMTISLLAVMALFSLWPEIDLKFSAIFFDAQARHFVGNHSTLADAMYGGIPEMTRVAIVLVIGAFLVSLCLRGERGRRWRIRTGFLVASLALSQGLIVDLALKDGWNRARPHHIAEFGGEDRFTPALVPSDQCQQNCSFVSGHAAAGFAFVTFGFLGGAVARRRWTLAGLALGLIVGFGRITQGDHFLSDVVFAFYVVWFSALLVWVVFNRLGWLPEREQAMAEEG